MRAILAVGLIILTAVLGVACSQPEASPTPEPTPAFTSTPTDTPAPTSTVAPAPTPEPTATATATPTPTQEATATPPEPAAAATATPSPIQEAKATPIPPDPETLLEGINAAMAAVHSVHMEGQLVVRVTEEADDDIVSAKVEGDGRPGGDGRSLITLSMKIGGVSATFAFETREVDGVSYSKDPISGVWEIDEADDSTGEDAFDAVLTGKLALEEMTVASDSLDGLPVFLVTGNVPDDPEAELLVLWVGVDDLLVRQFRMEGHPPASEYEGIVPPDIENVFQVVFTELSRFNEPVEIVAPQLEPSPTSVSRPPPTVVDTPFGPMAVFESARYPFSIQHPADWAEEPPSQTDVPACLSVTACFADDQGGVFAITEEDMAATGFGQLTLEEYVEIVISLVSATAVDFEIVSRQQITTSQGLTAELLEFTMLGGVLKASRLMYVHEGSIAFNASYLGPEARVDELEDLIEYSFGTFQVAEE